MFEPVKYYRVTKDINGHASETHITKGFPFVENEQVRFKDYKEGKFYTFTRNFTIQIIQ
jgi:hypothetical protein